MSLFVDIGQGAGLAGATGVRPFLPPLLAGALARGDIGLDFDDSGWEFLEQPWFLVIVLAIAVLAYLAERTGASGELAARGSLAVAVILGALLFAGSLAAGGHQELWGLAAGAACSVLAALSLGVLFERVAARLAKNEAGQAPAYVRSYADATALALAAIAIFVPPVSFAAIAAFLVLAVRGRGRGDRKYAGLRILR